jgi:leucyl-tRNA synthetase
LTLFDALDLFGADATRVALAESGDTLEDANFSCSSANKAVLTLYNALLWAEDVIQLSNEMDGKETKKIEREEDEEQKKHSHFEKLVDRAELSLADRIFDSQINQCIIDTDAAFKATNYREALFHGFFNLRTYRDEYRYRVGSDGLNRILVVKFLRVQALLMV